MGYSLEKTIDCTTLEDGMGSPKVQTLRGYTANMPSILCLILACCSICLMVCLIYLSLHQFGGVVDSDDKLVCVWWGGGKGGSLMLISMLTV